jgi:hypothetical protein
MNIRTKRFNEGLRRLAVRELHVLAPRIASFIHISTESRKDKWLIYYSTTLDLHNELNNKYAKQFIHQIKKRYCETTKLPVKHVELVYCGVRDEKLLEIKKTGMLSDLSITSPLLEDEGQ